MCPYPMIINHLVGLFAHPLEEWETIRQEHETLGRAFIHVGSLAAIPAICAFLGTTTSGWRIGTGEPIRLTTESALSMAVLYYLVLLAAVYSVGWMIHWMSETYGAKQPLSQCVVLAAYVATPLFLVGFLGVYPSLWLNLVVGLPALAYSVFLLYTGVPVMMDVPPERGFLFSSAILAVGLVGLVGILAFTVVLWGIGIGPVYTS